MNFKSYIDAIKYKKMGNESCFIIGGWCFSVSGEKVEYQVLVNGKAVKFDIQKIARRDVTQKNGEISAGIVVWILYDHSGESRSRSAKSIGALCCKRK